ncbi:PAS domain-containing protein [Flavobacterium sp.]|uniref:PAS domain-containing protein n=1 Tax=Flavobacterium sp. TaxID=239 RepID=UPI0026213AC8|nr:PAS domain-containing protein [Flavobacterium sp.]
MGNNYLKQDFYNYLKRDEVLFDKIISSNKKFFFIWDYENQDHIWISNSIWKKLGFKEDNQEDNLVLWKSRVNLLLTPKHNFTSAVETDFPKLSVEFKNIKNEQITTSIDLYPILNSDKSVVRLIGILDNNWNNLALSYSTKQFEILLGLYKTSYSNFDSIENLYREITASAAKGLNISRASIWEFEKDKLVCKNFFNSTTETFEDQDDLLRVDLPNYFDALQKGIAIVADDAQKNNFTEDLNQKYLKPLDVRSILDVPIRENGILIGILCCENTGAIKHWSDNDVSFARSITDILSLYSEESKRRKAEKNLMENQDRFKFISENITDGIYIVERDKMIFASSAYLKMVEMSFDDKNDSHKNDMFHLVHPDDKERVIGTIYGAIKEGISSVKYTFRCKKKDGTYMWREDIMNIQYELSGEAFRAVTIARDITQEKTQEIEEKKRHKAIDLQNQLLVKLYSKNTDFKIEDKIDYITLIAAEGLTIERASYWEVEGRHLVCRNLYDNVAKNHYSNQKLDVRDLPKYISTIKKKTALVADDALTNDATSELVESYLVPLGITDMLDIPVRKNGKFKGVLCCEHRDDPRVWSENDISFARALADYLSLALEEDKRKRTEAQLIESEHQLRLITENTSDGVAVIENDKLTYISPSYIKLLGYTKEYFKNFTIEDIFSSFHPDDLVTIRPYIRDCISKQIGELKYELRFKGANGEYHWREDSANVLYDENGKYSKYIVVTRDISARKEAEKEKNRLFEITEKQNEKLINFTHIVSHDIRSHTSNLSMILDLFEDTKNVDEQKEYFDMLKQSTNKLSDTIFYLNETVAIQSGEKKQMEYLNLKKEIEETIVGINAIIKTNEAVININIDDDLEVNLTQSYFESIIFNLLTNAIKYKSPKRNPVVTISAVKNDDEIQLTIQDNGMGIDLEKNKSKIFGMYKTFHGNTDAVGLGLFMVKNHIESMNGRIEIESEIDKGTTFNMYFV